MDRQSIRNADSPRGNEGTSAPDLFDFLFSRTSRMKMKEIVMEYQISIW